MSATTAHNGSFAQRIERLCAPSKVLLENSSTATAITATVGLHEIKYFFEGREFVSLLAIILTGTLSCPAKTVYSQEDRLHSTA